MCHGADVEDTLEGDLGHVEYTSSSGWVPWYRPTSPAL
jgi:hypothetical protein